MPIATRLNGYGIPPAQTTSLSSRGVRYCLTESMLVLQSKYRTKTPFSYVLKGLIATSLLRAGPTLEGDPGDIMDYLKKHNENPKVYI